MSDERPQPIRKIIHVDMDAFFASVEQRDNPELRGKPVVVGGKPTSRGVVAAASYEARRFGIHSAMACAHAVRLCPHALFIPPRFDAYRDASHQIMAIFHELTDLVEPLSLDEAFLDVTTNKLNNPSATWLAEIIRARIFTETGLTASAGVAPNKFLAKIASDMRKPNGLTVISPDRVSEVLAALPVRKIPGVGSVTEKRLREHGIETTADLRLFSDDRLQELFGRSGRHFARLARGEDDRPVEPHRERKSIGVEDTFATDIADRETALAELTRIAGKAWERLGDRRAVTVTVKVTYRDFEKATRAQTLDYPVDSGESLHAIAVSLLDRAFTGERPIRLLGVSLSGFVDEGPEIRAVQLTLPFRFVRGEG